MATCAGKTRTVIALIDLLMRAGWVKSLYGIPTWTRTVALVREHTGPLAALGSGDCPSVYACYRFTGKLRELGLLLDACFSAVVERVEEEVPGIGKDVAIDASDMPAYANG
jgi:hypothetical protein